MTAASLPMLLAGLCLGTLPAAAQEDCPVAADLDRGIRIAFEDGATEVYRRAGPGVVAVGGQAPDGSGYRMELAQGTHLLLWEESRDGIPDPHSRVTYDYGAPPAALPVPEPGGRWSAAVTVRAAGGPRSESQSQVWGQLAPIAIGACEYAAIEVLIAYATPDHYSEGLVYLPELGLAYLLWNETDEVPRQVVGATEIGVAK